MKSEWKVLSGLLALVQVGLWFAWRLFDHLGVGAAHQRVVGAARLIQGLGSTIPVPVSGPYTPTLSVAVRDLPADPKLPILRRELVQRDVRVIIAPDIQMPPHGNVLAELQQSVPKRTDGIGIVARFPGAPGYIDPPDTTGDVGFNHVLQGVYSVASTSQIFVGGKDGTPMASFYNAPYYPSIYYSARLSTDPLGTMPIYDQEIWDGPLFRNHTEWEYRLISMAHRFGALRQEVANA